MSIAGNMLKESSVKAVASRINDHLKAFEAAATKNSRGSAKYFNAGAQAAGSRIAICYVSYQGHSHLSLDEAKVYLAWLDAGNKKSHHEWQHETGGVPKSVPVPDGIAYCVYVDGDTPTLAAQPFRRRGDGIEFFHSHTAWGHRLRVSNKAFHLTVEAAFKDWKEYTLWQAASLREQAEKLELLAQKDVVPEKI